MIVVSFMRVWLSSSWCDGLLCSLSMMFWFSSFWCNVYLYFGDSNEQSIFNKIKEIKLMLSVYYRTGVEGIVTIVISNV